MAACCNMSAKSIADALNRGRARTKRTTQGYMALCPNHGDRNPSLSVRETENGQILLKCFATTCTDKRQVYASVEQALNLEPGALGGSRQRYTPVVAPVKIKNARADVQPIVPVPDDAPSIAPKCRHKVYGKPVNLWAYRNAAGRVMGYIARYDVPSKDGGKPEKLIWPWTYGVRNGRPQWCVTAMPEPRVPYNLDKIVQHPDAVIQWHEGERAADAGAILFPKWLPTTTAGGGNAPHLTDFSAFAGRTVVLCMDSDAPGADYMAYVTARLKEIGAQVWMLRFPTAFSVENGKLVDRPYIHSPGDDCADHLTNGWTTDLIREAVARSGLPLTWAVEEWA